jgi:hypothetical protein
MRIFNFLSVEYAIDFPEKYTRIGAISINCGSGGH